MLQISGWRRDWSWPTGLQCLWMIWEILFHYLSFSEVSCVPPMYLQASTSLTFANLGSEIVTSNATWLFLPAISWNMWPEEKDRWSWRVTNHNSFDLFLWGPKNSRHLNMLKKYYKCLNSLFLFSYSLSG